MHKFNVLCIKKLAYLPLFLCFRTLDPRTCLIVFSFVVAELDMTISAKSWTTKEDTVIR